MNGCGLSRVLAAGFAETPTATFEDVRMCAERAIPSIGSFAAIWLFGEARIYSSAVPD